MRATPVGAKAVEGGNAKRRREIAVAYATRQWRVPPVASHLVMAGVGLRTVQDLLGHKTLAMTLRYAHLSPAHQLDAVQRLNRPDSGDASITGSITSRSGQARVAAGGVEVLDAVNESSGGALDRTGDLGIMRPSL